jgi:hypothetical protein
MPDPTVFYVRTFLRDPCTYWVPGCYPRAFIKPRACGTWEVYAAYLNGTPPSNEKFGRVCSADDYFYAHDSDGQFDYIRCTGWQGRYNPPATATLRYWCRHDPPKYASIPMVTEEDFPGSHYQIYERPSGAFETYAVTLEPPQEKRRHLWRELTLAEYTALRKDMKRPTYPKNAIRSGPISDAALPEEQDEPRVIAYVPRLLPELSRSPSPSQNEVERIESLAGPTPRMAIRPSDDSCTSTGGASRRASDIYAYPSDWLIRRTLGGRLMPWVMLLGRPALVNYLVEIVP